MTVAAIINDLNTHITKLESHQLHLSEQILATNSPQEITELGDLQDLVTDETIRAEQLLTKLDLKKQ